MYRSTPRLTVLEEDRDRAIAYVKEACLGVTNPLDSEHDELKAAISDLRVRDVLVFDITQLEDPELLLKAAERFGEIAATDHPEPLNAGPLTLSALCYWKATKDAENVARGLRLVLLCDRNYTLADVGLRALEQGVMDQALGLMNEVGRDVCRYGHPGAKGSTWPDDRPDETHGWGKLIQLYGWDRTNDTRGVVDESAWNKHRAAWASTGVVAMGTLTNQIAEGTPEEVIGDLFGNLMHLCDYLGLDPEERIYNGMMHYHAEKDIEAQQAQDKVAEAVLSS